MLAARYKVTSNVAIYGAGSAGLQLYESLRQEGSYQVSAFVDDDTILKHLNQLSEGKVKTHTDFKLIDDKDIQKPRTYKKLKKKGKNYKHRGPKRR